MTHRHIVVINAGSSSIKYAFFDIDNALNRIMYGSFINIKSSPQLICVLSDGSKKSITDCPKTSDYSGLYQYLFKYFASLHLKIIAVGHRVVHGGKLYADPVVITDKIIKILKEYIPFAPLHQPFNIEAIEMIQSIAPTLLQVACFDTAFHRTHPSIADQFGLPLSLTQAGIRRYGFHGLSYEYITYYLKNVINSLPEKLIVAHLGNGASLCAIKNGLSIDSTMGFTALDGLMMGTRCGALDPGVVLYLMETMKMDPHQISDLLYKKSGLLGVSGISNNMKTLLDDNSPQAQNAIKLYTYRICREIGALIAVLKGIDMLVFTGGIGENAASVRKWTCEHFAWLGLKIDLIKNQENQLLISDEQSKIKVMIIPTNEEWMIAHHTQYYLG